MRTGEADMAALEATMRTVGEKIAAEMPRADRDDGGARHDGVRRVADPQTRLRRARHQIGAAAGAQLRARHAGTRVRAQHPRFLARLLGMQRRGGEARREVPPRGPQHEGFPPHRHGPADRIRDDEDRRELVPRDDPRVPERMESLRRAQRRRSHRRSSRRSGCARRTAI